MGQVPGPGHGDWVARMRELARRDAEELVSRPPFGIFGLAVPALAPAVLAGTRRIDDRWEAITLAYGDWAAPAGPFATVTTGVLPSHPAGPDTGAELARAIDQERNRLADHAWVDEPEPPGPPGYQPHELLADGIAAGGLLARHGGVWAARSQVGQVSVTVTGRGVVPDSVRLTPVTDLEPYLRGRGEVLGQLAERHRRRPPPVLAPAEGVAAYRALVDTELAGAAQIHAAVRAGRVPRHRAGEGAARHALWQRAVAEQARLSGISKGQADEIVTTVVNQLVQLQEHATWFTTEPRLREAAIGETLRSAVLGEDVASGPAQQAWAQYWSHHMSLVRRGPGADHRARHAASRPLSSAWLEAWSAWAQRPGPGQPAA